MTDVPLNIQKFINMVYIRPFRVLLGCCIRNQINIDLLRKVLRYMDMRPTVSHLFFSLMKNDRGGYAGSVWG